MFTKRNLKSVILAVSLLLVVTNVAQAAGEVGELAAIGEGPAWLAGQQQGDGRWEYGDTISDVPITGAALLDFLEAGDPDLEYYAGSTVPGQTAWQDYRSDNGQLLGLCVDVDTSAAGFTGTPHYFTSLAGDAAHWTIVGANSIYNATPTGFRVCIRYASGRVPTAAYANSKKWHIYWVGIRNHERVGSTVPGATPWQEYRSIDGQRLGIYVDVDTTWADLPWDARYLTSVGGDGGHMSLVGATSIYVPTSTGFRIYLKFTAPVFGERTLGGLDIEVDDPFELELERIWPGGQPPTINISPTPEYANEMNWHVNWYGSGGFRHTAPGATAWQEYRGQDGRLLGIYLDVDMGVYEFENTPLIFTSLGGDGGHWSTVGATSLYKVTPTGFRIYLRYASGVAPAPESANEKQWHLTWWPVAAWPPRRPDLILTDQTKTTITARFTDRSSNEWGFELQRRLGSGSDWQVVAEDIPWRGTGHVFSHTDEGLLPDTLYCYRVRVYNWWGEDLSLERCVRTLPDEVPLPDVSAGPIWLSYTSNPDDPQHDLLAYVPFIINVPIANHGDAPMPEFKFTYEAWYEGEWLGFIEYLWEDTLAPGEHDLIRIVEPYGFPGGEWDIRFVLDSDFAVREERENNNTATLNFTVYWMRDRGDP